MEYEYCLLGYQNKCTTEWGLLSFIHMQSQSNEHPLHNPSRTWPSLKALQQCGLFSPTTALKNPSFSAELGLSDLHQAFASPRHVMYTSSGAITYDYSFAWQRVKRALKNFHCQNSWQICWLRPTSDFLALIWTMTSSAAVLLSAASELEGRCSDSAVVCPLSDDEVTVSSDVLSCVDDASPTAFARDFKLSETAYINSWGRKNIAWKNNKVE